ncbi:SMP-30/gluconolactonase/LRE family protein [Streptomyces canus]
MTVDAEGCLWVALWGAGAVRRYHPDGHLLHTLTVPAPHPTSVCLPPTTIACSSPRPATG